MAVSRAAYRRLTDLYTVGKTLELRDGTVMWLQVMNPFERDEATHDASVARSRIMLALKETPDSDESKALRAMWVDTGRDGAIDVLIEAKKIEIFLEVMDEMKTDDEWREKVEMLQRVEDLSTVASETEREYIMAVQEQFALELARRLESATLVEKDILSEMSDEQVYDRYKEWWIEQRGGSIALAEYRLTEIWYAARACVAVRDGDDWDHSGCDGHTVRVFESKDDVKHLPEGLQKYLVEELAELEITEREGKS